MLRDDYLRMTQMLKTAAASLPPEIMFQAAMRNVSPEFEKVALNLSWLARLLPRGLQGLRSMFGRAASPTTTMIRSSGRWMPLRQFYARRAGSLPVARPAPQVAAPPRTMSPPQVLGPVRPPRDPVMFGYRWRPEGLVEMSSGRVVAPPLPQPFTGK